MSEYDVRVLEERIDHIITAIDDLKDKMDKIGELKATVAVLASRVNLVYSVGAVIGSAVVALIMKVFA